MDNETYNLTIEGQNNTFSVKNLTMNGNNYVSRKKVDTSKWPAIFKLTAKDSKGNITENIAHAKLLQQVQYDWDGGKYYLAFAQADAQELLEERIAANEEANTNAEIALCEIYEMVLGGE